MDLRALAQSAVERVKQSSVDPSTAVKQTLSGVPLNREQVARVCTMVNRELLGLQKSNPDLAGRHWASRIVTAKGDQIEVDAPSSVKTSSAPLADVLDAWEMGSEPLRKASSTPTTPAPAVPDAEETPLPGDLRKFAAVQDLLKISHRLEARIRDAERAHAVAVLACHGEFSKTSGTIPEKLGAVAQVASREIAAELLVEILRERKLSVRALLPDASEGDRALTADIRGELPPLPRTFNPEHPLVKCSRAADLTRVQLAELHAADAELRAKLGG